jgi:hypothetical protein
MDVPPSLDRQRDYNVLLVGHHNVAAMSGNCVYCVALGSAYACPDGPTKGPDGPRPGQTVRRYIRICPVVYGAAWVVSYPDRLS